MHAGRNFKLTEVLVWTRREIFTFIIIAAIPTILFEIFHVRGLGIPWLPVAVIGTAVAFLVGFKNNATYDRHWEARKIWGGIVNASRTWGIMSRDFVSNLHARVAIDEKNPEKHTRILIYRHLAWLTALRYQLRQPRTWENMNKSHNREYRKYFKVPELEDDYDEIQKKFLSEEELLYIKTKSNQATQLLSLQSKHLKNLLTMGLIEDFRHMELENMLKEFFEHQGKCERIKNFPYPRQFATINRIFIWIFILLLPFAMLMEFEKVGQEFVWFTIPFCTLISWVFHTMDKIGEATENPFEGNANDIPIAALSKTIEIDLREMLDEKNLPKANQPVNNILM